MTALLRRIFGLRVQPPARPIKNIRDLRIDDIIQFGVPDVTMLHGKRYRITEINAYLLGEERYLEYGLLGEHGLPLSLLITADLFRDEHHFFLRGLIENQEVGRLFDGQAFARLFEEHDAPLVLHRRGEPDALAGWTAPLYHQRRDAVEASFHSGDHRYLTTLEGGKALDYYLLMDEKERHGLMVEVYDQGETDISLLVRCRRNEIDGMWRT